MKVEETNRLFKYLIPQIKNHIRLRTYTTVGYMESGKTTLSLTIASVIENKLDGDFIAIYARWFKDVTEYVKDNPDEFMSYKYFYIIIDDAVRFQNSRNFIALREDVAEFFEIRHVFRRIGIDKGVVTVNYITQRWRSLDIAFRNAYAVIFKTVISHESSELKELARMLRDYFSRLLYITDKIYVDNNDSYKRFSIVRWGNGNVHEFELPFIAKPDNIIFLTKNPEETEKLDARSLMVIGAYMVLRNMGYTKTETLNELRKSGFKIRTKTYLDIINSWERGKGNV